MEGRFRASLAALRTLTRRSVPLLLCAFGVVSGLRAAGETAAAAVPDVDSPHRALVDRYCLSCHNGRARTAGLELDAVVGGSMAEHRDAWEKVVRKLRARQMPPLVAPRPEEEVYREAIAALESELDALAAASPDPGRTDAMRRLNRTEYRNAIRDLLHLDVDVSSLLPSDSSSFGFDNVTVADLSPTLLERYVGAADKISRLAVGRPGLPPGGVTVRMRPDITQEKHMKGMPLGTRGGALVPYTFPSSGVYEVKIRLARDRNEHVEGLSEPHDVDLLLDGEQMHRFTVHPAPINKRVARNYQPSQDNLDRHLQVRIPVSAGPHRLAVTFPKKPNVVLETARRPYEAHFNHYRHPRIQPAVYSVSIVGPVDTENGEVTPADTPSRKRLFVCRPEAPDPEVEDNCARDILETLVRRAYRRPITAADIERPFTLYRQVRDEDGFEAGIEMALAAVLVSPEFLFRVELDPPELAPGTPYRLDDFALASRLSFFLWSSIPDDELLEVATRGDLSDPEVLERQVRRMLADPRAGNLVTNFASQWLHLRNLDSLTPDKRLFADFDDNLRQAFKQETEMVFERILREDRSVLELVQADYTFVNERLAKHYGIPHVYGSRFRKVDVGEGTGRGGLLRHGSVLMVTSFANRTSPVIRGKWVLENLLGVPPPPPPANVPELEEAPAGTKAPTMRERLAQHRANPTCARCHVLTDPVGFALENYDAVGRWRTTDADEPIDASGQLFDGTEMDGVADLEAAIVARPQMFLTTMTEKLLTFATGRGVQLTDAAAVRDIVRQAEGEDYRFSSLILGVARSDPFQMRRTP